ncbi:MAG: hypothetical protein ACOX2P_04115 [Bacillota bacterium]|jgi:hypothetical protein
MKGQLGIVTTAAIAVVASIPIMYSGASRGNSTIMWAGLILFGVALIVGPMLKFVKKK